MGPGPLRDPWEGRSEEASSVVVISPVEELRAETCRIVRDAGQTIQGCASIAHARRLASEGLLDEARLDLVIVDIRGNLSDEDRRFFEERRAQGWPTSVLVLGQGLTVEQLLDVMRARADDFLEVPYAEAELLERVEVLVQRAREQRGNSAPKPEVVLAIGAHPDDVEIGAGGILRAHAEKGDEVHVLTLTTGERGGNGGLRAEEAASAADALGATLWLEDLPDTELQADGATVRRIEEHVRRIRPDVVYTHSLHDSHQDHRATHHAAVVATRRVPHVYCFESPSATVEFAPSRFVAIDEVVGDKLRTIEAYESQVAIRGYMQPSRVLASAHYWSRFTGSEYAEPLETVRDIGNPLSPVNEREFAAPAAVAV